jgi:hypothetical protein
MDMTELTSVIMLASIVVFPVIGLLFAYLFRRLDTQERLRAIEKGLSMSADPLQAAFRTRRTALALIGAGAGTIAGALFAATKLGSHLVAGIGLGLIPLGAGLALLLDYRLQRRSVVRHASLPSRASGDSARRAQDVDNPGGASR